MFLKFPVVHLHLKMIYMKEAILEKATEMFISYGYKSITMDDIAAGMGISKKTIYQHYSNKTELVEASAKVLLKNISNGIDLIYKENHNPIEEFFYIRRFISNLTNSEMSASFHQLKKYFPEISKQLLKYQFQQMHNWMIENLKRGIEAGLYRSDQNIEFTSRIYYIIIVGTKDNELFPDTLFTHDDISKNYLEYHLRAIVTDEGLQVLLNALKNLI